MKGTRKPLIQAATGQKPDRTPVWFLRQAGRYLPEYRQIRSKVSFLELCQNPELASEVTLQPLRRFDLDAAIIFADILLPCMSMGQTLTFDEGHGPHLSPVIRSDSDLKSLKSKPIAKDLSFVGDAIAKTKLGLQEAQTMIGFAGAPFTVASYMIEGCGSKNYTEVKRLAYNDPQVFRSLLDQLATNTYDYLEMQVKAGAETLMLFDSWVANFSHDDYLNFVFPPTSKLISKLKNLNVPIVYFPGQGSDHLHQLSGITADVIAIDWKIPLDKAIAILKAQNLNVSVQGNLDPQSLIAPPEILAAKVRDILNRGKSARGHIFNVGHGLLPHTPPESLKLVIDTIRSHS